MERGPILDILVVGGGVVGAGAALDAVSRGLRVGVVEARDWASGSSSRSSKLIHGGLRYLEMLDFRLVREALRERSLIMGRLAPHLVRPVPFLLPLRHRGWERVYIGSGMLLYDTMGISFGRARGVPHHRHLSRSAALRVFPGLRSDGPLTGAIVYYDGEVDDARHTLTLVRTAASRGALCASSLAVTGFLRDGVRVVGAQVRDRESGRSFDIRARRVINATGVWTDDTQSLVGAHGQFHVRASKGIHIVVPRRCIRSAVGLTLRTEKSVLFIIPWGRHWIIGTTDTDWALDKAHPAASASDIEYLLEHVNRVLAAPLTRADIVGVYTGLRPLLAGESESTSKLSREHAVGHPAPGLVVIAGGKYTTYRVMAADAVDAAVRDLGPVPPSRTADLALLGAEGFAVQWSQRAATARRSGLDVATVEHLLGRYGGLVDEVLALVNADQRLADPLPGDAGYLGAEVTYAAAYEGALHLDDVLTRRTRTSIEARDRGAATAPVAARLMAAVLGWSEERTMGEVTAYLDRLRAERASQDQPDDVSADSARLQAVRPAATARSDVPRDR